jgi:hypothetical protein
MRPRADLQLSDFEASCTHEAHAVDQNILSFPPSALCLSCKVTLTKLQKPKHVLHLH